MERSLAPPAAAAAPSEPRLSLPPGPPPVTAHPLSLLAYWRRMRREPVVRLNERFDLYGDIYRTSTLGFETYVLRHPQHIQEVLITRAGSFEKPSRGPTARRLRQLLGEGLLNSNGELWRRQRRLIQPAFRKERLEAYAELFVDHTERQIDGWQHDQHLDVSREMMELTLGVVSKALFDYRVTGEADRVADAMRAIRRAFRSADVLLPDWVITADKLRTRRALADLGAIIERLVDAERRGEGAGLLSALAGAVDEDSTRMSPRQLRDELLTLFIAGHETTAHALSWTLHLLSTHPEIEARVHAEIAAVIGSRRPCFGDVERMPYTEQVLCEVLRLFPPAYVTPRVASEDTRIGDYRVSLGTNVLIWIYHTHHDARWFPDPERFDPERFAPARRRDIPAGAYLPFGAGMRTCIGKQFAVVEAMLILACVLRRCSLHAVPATRVQRDMALTLAPKGRLTMQVRRRIA